ncbi:MAG: hypothetical protein U0264_13120 [Candidatus Kapaibacterium sp.]
MNNAREMARCEVVKIQQVKQTEGWGASDRSNAKRQSRAEQSRAEQSRAEQSRAECEDVLSFVVKIRIESSKNAQVS